MSFKVGDFVFVLDDDLSGEIVRVSGDKITILTKDDFELDFNSNEVVKQENTNTLKHNVFTNASLQHVVSEKETKKRKVVTKKAKERYEPTFEVDLHIHHLTKSSRGMSNHDMLNLQLDTARRQLEFAINKRIQKMVFIHGVGEGVLKTELEYLLGRYNVKYYEANYQKYGLGATEVYIYQNTKP
ncbi:DNA mismatch repair protein MutS [Lacinutrix sp. C3R15]|uniref:Smr/MutS family protein n=1 Tax=Flavobacteriaceae TaxID=49546 RepID=UPI001C09B18A|nr:MULTISPECIES: Smr/MutS family protein [Flavobacteriaceae]MBU2940332.1 DNA mismatch repair protein MutS [Lacinutrix sp. C3R15]MDO6623652.1 DNA mismatch repair protein MutS [Oceanihabitans sp. 1_MG-2023]